MSKKKKKHGPPPPPAPPTVRGPDLGTAAAPAPVAVAVVPASPAPAALPSAHVPSAPSAGPAPAYFTFQVNRRRLRFALLATVGAAALALAHHLRDIVNPILLSLLLAYVLNPVVAFFERYHLRRPVTVFCIYLLLVGFAALAVIVIVPAAATQSVDFYRRAVVGDQFKDTNGNGVWDASEPITLDLDGDRVAEPSYLEQGRLKVRGWVAAWNQAHPGHELQLDELLEKAREALARNGRELAEKGLDVTGTLLGLLSSGLSGLFAAISYGFLVPMYVYFFLIGMKDIQARVTEFLPGLYRDDILRILREIDHAVSSFFRGKVVVCLLKGLVTFLGLALVGSRFSLVFGLLQAGGSVVPFLSAVLSLVPALVVAWLDHGLSVGPLLAVAAVFGAAEAAEFVLTPLILGKEVGLHPVTLIVALFVGGSLLGFLGVLLAVPLASIVKILSTEFLLPQLRALAQERKETP
ncbi:MAG: AI-2E family transporter [Planctomycetes bacterium]|nr:AI-2E family transporter [Planctomycetota bacterium]